MAGHGLRDTVPLLAFTGVRNGRAVPEVVGAGLDAGSRRSRTFDSFTSGVGGASPNSKSSAPHLSPPRSEGLPIPWQESCGNAKLVLLSSYGCLSEDTGKSRVWNGGIRSTFGCIDFSMLSISRRRLFAECSTCGICSLSCASSFCHHFHRAGEHS